MCYKKQFILTQMYSYPKEHPKIQKIKEAKQIHLSPLPFPNPYPKEKIINSQLQQ